MDLFVQEAAAHAHGFGQLIDVEIRILVFLLDGFQELGGEFGVAVGQGGGQQRVMTRDHLVLSLQQLVLLGEFLRLSLQFFFLFLQLFRLPVHLLLQQVLFLVDG